MVHKPKGNKLLWSRLKSMQCPKCGKLIRVKVNGQQFYSCTNEKGCDFIIGLGRFNELVDKLYKKSLVNKFEKQSAGW